MYIDDSVSQDFAADMPAHPLWWSSAVVVVVAIVVDLNPVFLDDQR